MITELTSIQENRLSLYKEKWLNKIFNYELYNSKTEENIIKSGKKLYEFCNLKEPMVLVADSPLACQLIANFINQIQISNLTGDQIGNQVRDQVRDQVLNPVIAQIDKRFEDQTDYNQIMIQIGNQIVSQIGNQIRDRVRDQVLNQVIDQVDNQIDNQVDNQVENQVDIQIWDQVIDQVGNQVGNQIRVQIRNQILGQIRDQVKDQSENQIVNQVKDQISNQIWNQIWNQIVNQISNQVEDRVKDQKLTYFAFSSYINYTDFGWCSFYDYFNTEFNIIEKKLSDNFNKIIDFVDHSFMSIQFENLLIISKYPNFISRNSNNDLHNTKRSAVSFKDGYEQFYVNGRFIEKEIFENCQEIESAKIIFQNETNEDIKAAIITIIKENFGNEGLLEMLDAVVIDEQIINHPNNYTEKIRILHSKQKYSFLQNSKGKLNQPYAWIEMTCPSTGSVYLIDTCPTFKNALECAKWHRPDEIPVELEYSWISAN